MHSIRLEDGGCISPRTLPKGCLSEEDVGGGLGDVALEVLEDDDVPTWGLDKELRDYKDDSSCTPRDLVDHSVPDRLLALFLLENSGYLGKNSVHDNNGRKEAAHSAKGDEQISLGERDWVPKQRVLTLHSVQLSDIFVFTTSSSRNPVATRWSRSALLDAVVLLILFFENILEQTHK